MALLQDTGRKNDVLIGNTGEADRFFFNRDGKRDIVSNFEHGVDVIDLSHYSIDFSQLKIVNKWDGTGVRIALGEEKFFIQGDAAENFGADDFVFTTPASGNPPGPYTDHFDTTNRNDWLKGTAGADRFVMLDDGQRDVIGRFRDGEDVIDLTDFGVTFDDLKIVNKNNGKGVRIVIDDEKLFVRGMEAADFSADDFLF